MSAYHRLVLRGIATIIRILLRSSRDIGGDALTLAKELEDAAKQ